MSSQNQGVSLSSPTDPPMRRKRGRPRKDETFHRDNSPVTPASDNLNRNKQSVESTCDPPSDEMVGQMVSGVIEGSFDAGYLLNVKVGDTNTYLRGVVFLPGRFAPITAANDVAPNAKMYKRREIPFPFVSSQGHLHAVSPPSGKIEHKNDTPKLPERGLPIGLPPARNLPINDPAPPLGHKDLQDLVVDIGLQNGKAVGFEAFKTMEGPNINVEEPKASEPVSATCTASLPVSETANLKPQVEHQAVSSDPKPHELVGNAKSLDLVNDQTNKFPEVEAQVIPCEHAGINMFRKQGSKFPDLEPQAVPCEPAGINMFGKQSSKFPEPKPQAMPCEPAGIGMLVKQASKFPEHESQALPCESAGIDMLVKQASNFPEPEPQPMCCESAGSDMLVKQASKFPEPEPQAMPCEPSGLNIFGKQGSEFTEPKPQAMPCGPTVINMFGKQPSKFPEPEPQPIPCEPTGINLFVNQAFKFPEPEPQPIPCEPTGINMFVNQASKFPEPEHQAIPCEPMGIDIFGKQTSKFPESEPEHQAIPCEPIGIDIFGKQTSKFPESEPQAMSCEPVEIMFGKQASKFPEPQAMPFELTGINMFGKQASKFLEPEPHAIPCEPTGINMFGKPASSRQDMDISQDTQLELAKKIMTGADMAHTDGLFASDAATTTAAAPCPASITSLPIMIFGAETIPSGHKPATEESVLPRMVVPEVSSSSMAINTNSVESNAKDAIPPAQS